MTKKALKLLLSFQAKGMLWFVSIYALIMIILLIIFQFVKIDDQSWMLDATMYAPKIYLLVIGIINPLMLTEIYVSRGLTRKQFFWATTGAISVLSLFLVIPVLASVIYFNSISLLQAITHYLHLPLFFLIGWTAVVGFQLRKWHVAIIGVLSAIAMFHGITTVTRILALSDLAVLGSVLLLLAAVLLILPRIISQIPVKS